MDISYIMYITCGKNIIALTDITEATAFTIIGNTIITDDNYFSDILYFTNIIDVNDIADITDIADIDDI